MSGGFFRGTSADQDTRFSNKQAKLLKSQKFAPELDQLVDMTKVKMDVMRPWIATRATEFLGFEDEVLINFIYGLLDSKVVDGKQIQIQITGFMEKNTGKFMKELWSLLLSAQKNASGVPQQFLDAKEEETRKKKAEADLITYELQKKKEREEREFEREQHTGMDDEMDVLRTTNSTAVSKNSLLRASGDREASERLSLDGKNRLSKSPPAVNRSPYRSSRPASRSHSKSFSNSRSYSRSPDSSERHKSRIISGSPLPQKRSPSLESRRRSPIHSPRRRSSPQHPRPPSRRRSPRIRQRSPLPVRRRSPSPVRRRSPSPVRHRSRTPVRRRSPSPIRRKFPSPFHRRSPSPFRRRHPSPRQRSPSPMRRSPLTRSPRFHRRSPRRQVVNSHVSPRRRNRSRSPYGSQSPYKSRRSLSRERDDHVNGLESRRYRDGYASQRSLTKRSPNHHSFEREDFEHPGAVRKGPESKSRPLPVSLRSPQRDVEVRIDSRNKVSTLSSPPDKSLSQSKSRFPKVNLDKDNRKPSPVENPARPTREHAIRHDNPEIRGEEEEKDHSRENLTQRDGSLKHRLKHSSTVLIRSKSPAKVVVQEYSSPDYSNSRKKDNNMRSVGSPQTDRPERQIQQTAHVSEEVEYGPGRLEREKFSPSSKRLGRIPSPDEKFSAGQVSLKKSHSKEGYRVDEKKHTLSSNVEYYDSGPKTDALQKSMKRVDHNQVAPFNSDGEENMSYRSRDTSERKKREQKSLDVAWNNEPEPGSVSPVDERKEAKRRKKEEKRLRKVERRRRREERHRRREERCTGKQKAKSVATVSPPSDLEKKNPSDIDDSEDDGVARGWDPHLSDTEETDSEQKRLEIELRKKALESLRAKKAISH